MSSSSSPRGNSLGIVPVLFLIAMDEQTFSLILPYQPANWLPQNSPERRPPAAHVGLVVRYILEQEGPLPQGRAYVWGRGAVCGLWNPRLTWNRTWESKEQHTSSLCKNAPQKL